MTNGAPPQIRNDGALLNALGAIQASDASPSVQVSAALGQTRHEDLAQHWLIAAMCNAYPDEATRNGWEVTLATAQDAQVLNDFNAYRETVGGETEDEELIRDTEIFGYAGYLANVYGGAAIVMAIDDGAAPSEPVRSDRIKTISFLEVMDPYEITPVLDRTNNPFRATHYRLTTPPVRGLAADSRGDRLQSMFEQGSTRRSAIADFTIHRSRVLRIPGQRVPRRVMVEKYRGWDQSLIDRVYEPFEEWRSVSRGVKDLIEDYSLFVYALEGLQEMVAEGNEDRLRKRFQALRKMVAVLGGAAIDADKEKIDFVQRQFGGIPDLVDRYRDIVIGASGQPHTVLFGESPSGLGATGESEEKTLAKRVGQYQVRVVAPRLRRLFRLIWLAKDGPTGGQEPQGWGVRFHSLLEQSEAEKISNLTTFVGALSQGINGGFLLADEARTPFAAAAPTFDITLDPDKWEAQQQQNEQGFDFGFGGSAEAEVEEEPAAELTEEEAVVKQDSDRSAPVFADEDLHKQAIADAKRRFKVYPSAYANAFMTKRYRELYRDRHGSEKGAFQSQD